MMFVWSLVDNVQSINITIIVKIMIMIIMIVIIVRIVSSTYCTSLKIFTELSIECIALSSSLH